VASPSRASPAAERELAQQQQEGGRPAEPGPGLLVAGPDRRGGGAYAGRVFGWPKNTQVGPRIPVGLQLEKAEVGPTPGPTWHLSHSGATLSFYTVVDWHHWRLLLRDVQGSLAVIAAVFSQNGSVAPGLVLPGHLFARSRRDVPSRGPQCSQSSVIITRPCILSKGNP
jgi:hypothetical protein